MNQTIRRATATLALACCSVVANAGILSSMTHDYGSTDGANALNTFQSCDILNATSITVRETVTTGCARFLDSFNFGTSLGTVTSLSLTLTVGNTNDGFESWAMRPATSATNGATVANSQTLQRSTAALSKTFVINNATNPSEFNTIVNNGNFFLWFSENGVGANTFTLYSATLDVIGDAPVPEPGSLALFGLGALAMGAVARKRRQV